MPNDVSDEALEKLIAASLYHDEHGVFPFTREEIILFAKRIRDLTARRCIEANRAQQLVDPQDCEGDTGYMCAVEDCVNSLLRLFPDSCTTTEEKQDGG